MFSLHAQGNVTTFNFAVGKTIHLKEGCSVLLLYNFSEDLRNGTTGKLVKVEEDKLDSCLSKSWTQKKNSSKKHGMYMTEMEMYLAAIHNFQLFQAMLLLFINHKA